jgi:hypothetical protein
VPLDLLTLAATRVKIPPLPATSHVINFSPEQALIPKQPAKQPTPDENSPSTKNGRVTKAGGKGSKMRLSPTKNVRYVRSRLGLVMLLTTNYCSNLCALRWLKQIQTNGTTEQFCAYYGDLTAGQRKVRYAFKFSGFHAYIDTFLFMLVLRRGCQTSKSITANKHLTGCASRLPTTHGTRVSARACSIRLTHPQYCMNNLTLGS